VSEYPFTHAARLIGGHSGIRGMAVDLGLQPAGIMKARTAIVGSRRRRSAAFPVTASATPKVEVPQESQAGSFNTINVRGVFPVNESCWF
jgi:hypothetical protein